MDIRSMAAWASVACNAVLTAAKFIVGFIMGSVSVISEAIHSANDLLASLIALFAVKTSSKPPDDKHPYGHGKIENISGTIEAIMIFIAAIMIVKEAIDKIRFGGDMTELGWGIAVMGFSSLMNLGVAIYELKIGKTADSVALEADGMHHLTDVFTSLGVFLGLILIKATGIQIIDPIAAILVALLIIYAAVDLTRKAFAPLLDTSLEEERIRDVEDILLEYSSRYHEFHDLRARKAGRETHIDLHLVINHETTVAEAHDLCDMIEERINSEIPHSHVLIHVEPLVPDDEETKSLTQL